nr:hypothetical protein [Actinomadura litoris]
MVARGPTRPASLGQAGGRHHRGRHGHQRRRGQQRRPADHGLEEREQDNEDARLDPEDHHERDRADGQTALTEQPHVQQRGVPAAPFPDHEGGRGDEADGEADQRRGRGPAAPRALLQGEDEGGHGDDGHQRADGVEGVAGALVGVGNRRQRQGQGHDDQRYGQDELPAPVGDVDEKGGQEHAEDAAASGDARPYADRLAALLLGEGGGDDGQGDGHDRRRADPAGHARGEHDLRGRGQSRRDARDAEDGQPGDQRRLAAQAVTDRAERQQQRRQRERVDVDDPQDRVLRGVEVDRHVRLGDVQPGHRRDDGHERHRDGDQDRAQLTRVRCGPVGGCRPRRVRDHGFLSRRACGISAGAGPVAG